MREEQRVTERDQFLAFFCRLNARHARRREHIALRDGVRLNQLDGFALQTDFAARHRFAQLHWLG